jgi:hypothetical protein
MFKATLEPTVVAKLGSTNSVLVSYMHRRGSLAVSNGLVYFLFMISAQSKKTALKFTCNSHALLVIELARLQTMAVELSGNDSTTHTMYLVFKKKYDSLNSTALRGCVAVVGELWMLQDQLRSHECVALVNGAYQNVSKVL